MKRVSNPRKYSIGAKGYNTTKCGGTCGFSQLLPPHFWVKKDLVFFTRF